VYVWVAPVPIVDVAGLTTIEAGGGPATVSSAVPLTPSTVPVTVYVPGAFAPHELAAHEPGSSIVNAVRSVTSPRSWPSESYASAVYVWVVPGSIVDVAGVSVTDAVGRWPGATRPHAAPTLAGSVTVTPAGMDDTIER
jgi:hypothetical protein